MRQRLEEVRRHQRDQAEADGNRDHEQVALVGLEIHRGEDAGAGRGDHAEHHEAGGAEHHLRYGLHQRGHLRQQAEHQHDAATGDGHPARAHAGDADQTDILRERRVGEGVEDAAKKRADAVGAQALGQCVPVDGLAGYLAERQEHAE